MLHRYLAKSTVAVPETPMEMRQPYGGTAYRFTPAWWGVYFWVGTEHPLYSLVGLALTKAGRPRADGYEVALDIPASEVPPEVLRDLARVMEDQLDAYIEERQEEIDSVLRDLD
jgi:hypothetical protein